MSTRRTSLFALLTASAIIAAACGERARGGTSDRNTGGTNTISVTDITLGRSINADLTIKDNTTTFKPVDVVYASIATEGAAPATLGVRWTYQDNQVVDQGTREIRPIGPTRTEFHFSKPDGLPEGRYRLEVTLNGASAGTKEFEIKR